MSLPATKIRPWSDDLVVEQADEGGLARPRRTDHEDELAFSISTVASRWRTTSFLYCLVTLSLIMRRGERGCGTALGGVAGRHGSNRSRLLELASRGCWSSRQRQQCTSEDPDSAGWAPPSAPQGRPLAWRWSPAVTGGRDSMKGRSCPSRTPSTLPTSSPVQVLHRCSGWRKQLRIWLAKSALRWSPASSSTVSCRSCWRRPGQSAWIPGGPCPCSGADCARSAPT